MKNLYTLLMEKMNAYDAKRRSSTQPEGLHHPSVSPEKRKKRIKAADKMAVQRGLERVDFLKSVKKHRGKEGVKDAIRRRLGKLHSLDNRANMDR